MHEIRSYFLVLFRFNVICHNEMFMSHLSFTRSINYATFCSHHSQQISTSCSCKLLLHGRIVQAAIYNSVNWLSVKWKRIWAHKTPLYFHKATVDCITYHINKKNTPAWYEPLPAHKGTITHRHGAVQLCSFTKTTPKSLFYVRKKALSEPVFMLVQELSFNVGLAQLSPPMKETRRNTRCTGPKYQMILTYTNTDSRKIMIKRH